MRKLTAVLLIIALLAAAILACAAEGGASLLGQPFPDFTVQTIDGGTFTLSEALKDHDAVLINFWATWCGYCEEEFPYLEEAYEKYGDRVAVIALSGEPSDTLGVLKEYAKSLGLTFPIASAVETGLADIYAPAYPTSVAVDRFGNVALIYPGAVEEAADFAALFDYLLRDGYTETELLQNIPAKLPDVKPASNEALDAAGNAGGGGLAFRNPEGAAVWPMVPCEDSERTALMSTNARVPDSRSAVCFDVEAADGDALAFDFKTSLEPVYDALFVEIDGAVVKCFAGEHDWETWALPLEAGKHAVVMGCEKDDGTDAGRDRVWIDEIRIASGDDAAALLAALPAYPTAEAFELTLADADAREIQFEDENRILLQTLGTDRGWIVNGDSVTAEIALTAEMDPETICVVSTSGASKPIREFLKADGSGYSLTLPLNPGEYLAFGVLPGRELEGPVEGKVVVASPDEAGVENFLGYYAAYGFNMGWHYVEEETADEAEAEAETPAETEAPTEAETPAETEAPAEAEATYTVRLVDQNGDPVPGVSLTFCTDSLCDLAEGDENGVITYVGEPFAYHLQVVVIPEGYRFDDSREIYTEARSGKMTLEFVKE